MITDADIEMAELEYAGNVMAAGCCVLCESPLDPTNPKWAGQFDTHRVLRMVDGVRTTVVEPWSPEQEAEVLGPPSDIFDGYHQRCFKAMTDEDDDENWG